MSKRTSFNVSLQRKRNQVALGPILERSEREGTVASDIIVEYVEKALDYEKIVGLNKVMNTYKLIQNIVSSQCEYGSDEYYRRVEAVLRDVVIVDGSALSSFLSDPVEYTSGGAPTTYRPTPTPIASGSIETETSSLASIQEDVPLKKESTLQEETDTLKIDDDALESDSDRRRRERAERRQQQREEAQRQKEQENDSSNDDDELEGMSLNVGAIFND